MMYPVRLKWNGHDRMKRMEKGEEGWVREELRFEKIVTKNTLKIWQFESDTCACQLFLGTERLIC